MQDFSASVEAADPTSLVALAAKAEQAQPDDSAPASEDLDPTSLMVLARAGEAGTKPDEDAESPKPTDATARRIREIIGLAHSANKIDRERYGELQPELTALMSGEKTVFTRDDLALVKDDDGEAPVRKVPEIYELNWGDEAPSLTTADQQAWTGALAEFKDADFSQAQVDVVTKLYARASQEADQAREAAEQAKSDAADRAEAKAVRELEREFGDEYAERVEATNLFLRETLSEFVPGQKARTELLNLRLESGERLGSLPVLVRWLDALRERYG